MLYNIFSKKKKINQEPSNNKNNKIIIDIHEKNSLVPSYLQEMQAEIEFKSLKVGDYIISDIVIERKTISDFISSMISKRLAKQLNELQTYKKKLLVLEGKIEEQNRGFNPNAIRGMILTIELEMNIPIIFTENSEDTAKFLLVLAKKLNKSQEFSFHSRKGLTKKEQKQYILESLQGIGPSTSKKLLKKFKNLKTIFNLSEQELEKELGKKSESFKILEENY